MGLLRSETMRYGMLVLPAQDAKAYVEKLGTTSNVQFEDMNAKEMRRPFRRYVQRIDEMERIIRFLSDQVAANPQAGSVVKNNVDHFLATSGSHKLDGLEAELAGLWKQFVKFKENNDRLTTEWNSAMEESQVVRKGLNILSGIKGGGLSQPLMDDVLDRRIGTIAGVVSKADQARFALAIWRASRGNTFTEFEDIQGATTDPKTGLVGNKSVFVVYFQGTGGDKSAMHQKVLKVCQGFGVNLYAYPADAAEAKRRDAALFQTLVEKQKARDAFQNLITMEIQDLLSVDRGFGNSKIEEWRLFCMKEKSVYTILNMCAGDMLLRVNVWYPADEEQQIQDILRKAVPTAATQATLMPDRGARKSAPPTYCRVNDFTAPWQDVINTYGVPRYQEANPAVLTYVTFPFTFGMMYGDIGHGFMLFCAGVYLVMFGEKFKYSVNALYTSRYLVLQLGLFATFAGFLYNDFFSLGIQLFDSTYEPIPGDANGNWRPKANFNIQNCITNAKGESCADLSGPYPFGLDWAWHGATNELLFVNSLKMKLSVLFGVLQMTVGLLLRWSNAFYEKNMCDFIFECIPMMIFMLCFFGWMDYMIMYKWTHFIAGEVDPALENGSPSIINSLICMTMGIMGQEDLNPLYDGSPHTANVLMAVTAGAVPFMLFPKPFILRAQHNAAQKQKEAHGEGSSAYIALDEEEGAGGGGHGHGDEFEFGEVFIHQIIETIEFVLGTVSHTASYLRIWALSLAHQQLSVVFFQKTLQMGLLMEMSPVVKGIVLYCLFCAWFMVTVGVLLGMDVLECFLHTLRLHWVEFQSKFFRADGYSFEPYSIQKIIDPANEA